MLDYYARVQANEGFNEMTGRESINTDGTSQEILELRRRCAELEQALATREASLIESCDVSPNTNDDISSFIYYPELKDVSNRLVWLTNRERQPVAPTEKSPEDALLDSAPDRERIKAALSESRRTLATLTANIPGMVYRCLNDKCWSMLFVSEACSELTGYAPEDLISNNRLSFADLILPGYRNVVEESIQDSLLEHKPFELTYPIRTANAEEKWVWERGRGIYSPNGELIFLEGFITDITARKRAEDERRKLEAQIQHAQKLESLGVLAGGIAHDFNNILLAILGNLDLALAELPIVSPVRENLLEAEKASRRAADLCHQMLAYSGKGHFVIQALDLSELIEEMSHMLEVSISKKAVFRYDLAENLPLVEADATQIRQIVMNLVLNASEAIGEKSGLIRLATGAMECDRAYLAGTWLDENHPEGLYVHIEVSDTGSGMNEQTRAKIFDPFFTTKFTGRGLGLAAVLGIVRGHNGAIKVYSEPGRGTTFRVLFPSAKNALGKGHSAERDAKLWRGNGVILLVDDEETVRAVAKKMLERLGFSVSTASDGREALEIFRKDPDAFACVMLDLTMPHMDGEEAFRELRKIRQNVRVIMASGYSEQEVEQRFLGKGVATFMQKPYQLATLSSRLREVLEEAKV
jgi:PAS domain S-box-containing protein